MTTNWNVAHQYPSLVESKQNSVSLTLAGYTRATLKHHVSQQTTINNVNS